MRKLNYVLLSALVYCMVNPIYVWTQTTTFNICPGESIFLPAIQAFPTPAQPPQGPGGGIPATPCTPQLNAISILPISNALENELTGFTVSPMVSTTYTVTSNGVCGGPGSAGFGEEAIIYEVIVNNCSAPTIDATIVICQGESVFLDAVQTFPTPPQPPQGPDGSIPATPCTPELNGIDIAPLNNVAATSLAGFTVSPTETTIYTVTSTGTCGGPGSGNFGEETITYEVVVQTDCGTTPVPIDATLIICQGESAFLEAIQIFPTPPQPPQGPDGGIAITPCTPELNGIDIAPLNNVAATSLAGFTVSPTETTIYTVTSNGACGGPGSGNSGELAITYEVVVDNTCGQTTPINVINQFPWLTGIFDPNSCNGESIVVYQQGSYQYVLVRDGEGDEKLYFENGDFYCQGSPSYDCAAAFGFTSEAGRWSCGDGVAACGSNSGTFFFDECDGQTFYFIRLADGRVYDPYFADGISFEPEGGESVLFDFTIANFSTPCTNAEAAIIITCLSIDPITDEADGIEIGSDELTTASLFPAYSSWIGALIDVNNCQGETVTVYSKDGYEFILIKDADGVERLYLEDGTFYCENSANYDCMVAYGFMEMLSYWECDFEAPVPADIIFTDFPWLNDIVVEENCETELIQVYESGGYQFLSVTTNGVTSLYFEDGTFYCQNQANYICNVVYGFGAPTITWLCGTALSELPATNFVNTNEVATSLSVYPNPTNGVLNMSLAFSEHTQSLRLIDLYGKTLATKNVAASEAVHHLTFDLTAYPAGIYYVEWVSGLERGVEKVVRR